MKSDMVCNTTRN